MMEQIGPGCALLDYDGDGWMDIYLLNGRDRYGRGIKLRNALYRNNRDGTFTDVTEQAGVPGTGYGLGVAVGDFDNDGNPDIYLCQYGKNVLYHNNGNGTFTDVTEKAGVGALDFGEPFHISAAWVDYDRDGFLDLFVASYVNFESGPRYCKEEGVPIPHGCPPKHYKPTHYLLFHNNRHGGFENVTKKAGLFSNLGKSLGVTIGDFDDDGWQDIYAANDSTNSFLFRNNRNGTFSEAGYSGGVAVADDGNAMAAMGVDFGDYENNGRLSLFVSDFQDKPNHLFQNKGGGMFADVAHQTGIGPPSIQYLGFGGGFLDYDNDGWLDIIVANGHVVPEIDSTPNGARGIHFRQRAQLFHNRHNGTFDEVTESAGPAFAIKAAGRGAAWGDIWNRGVEDILVINSSGPTTLMKHSGPMPERHFLSLRLTGTTSNHDAIGARVYVTAEGRRQMQEVKTSRSYLSSGDPRLHFGLGTARTIDKIEVRWPNGGVATLTQVAADRFYEWKEGENELRQQSIAGIKK